MGELEPWMDDNYVRQIWYQYGENVNFLSNAAAVKALASLNGTSIPGTNRIFKLNWAFGGGLADKKDDRIPEFSIFVGDLGPDVNEWILMTVFYQRYPSCKSAKIMTDPMTGISRGYGFVRFGEEIEQQRALIEMQGAFCGNRPMRISTAIPKNKLFFQGNPRVRMPWGRIQNDKTAPNYRPQLYNSLNNDNDNGGYLPNTITDTNTTGANSIINGNSNGGGGNATVMNITLSSQLLNNNSITMMMTTMDPLEPIPVQHMNELFISSKEALIERMEIYTSTSNNWSDNVFMLND
ncbi:7171_t:CDS:2 [Entrophospora sp. SA101]|nr:8248_t:CDS:2 [Entrophospora sp. SA101]CAJ0850294.1 7171_t:CDS:2 [Entrophospora sp. SA101]CAJ0894938.1 14546_t:CDS:2 [Entrophospora sp. SA101]